MTIQLYQNRSEPNRVDKTDYLYPTQNYTGTLRNECSITSPIITIEYIPQEQFTRSNYAYIPEFNRYYFITDIVYVRNGLIELYMSVDVLMSHKTAILSCKGFIERNEYLSNSRLIDKKRVIEEGVDVEYIEVPNNVFITNGYECVINGYKIRAVVPET